MATKSIYKDVRIKNKVLCRNFVSALEHAENKKGKDVIISRKVQILNKEKIKEIFGKG